MYQLQSIITSDISVIIPWGLGIMGVPGPGGPVEPGGPYNRHIHILYKKQLKQH